MSAAIQPHGALLAVRAEPPCPVTHASANLAAFLGCSPQAAFGLGLADLLGDAAGRIVALGAGEFAEAGPARCDFITQDGRALSLRAHRDGAYIYMDIEARGADVDCGGLLMQAQSLLERLAGSETCPQLCSDAAAGCRALFGYDRVMVIRFTEQGRSEVFAEAHAADLEPLLGRQFALPLAAGTGGARPAGRVQMVADSAMELVPILADPGCAADPSDWRHSALRGPDVALQAWLTRLDSRAGLAVSLYDGADMFGLLLCLHAAPLLAAAENRAAASVIGEFVALHVVRLVQQPGKKEPVRLRSAELARATEALRVRESLISSAESRLERAQVLAGLGTWEYNVATEEILLSNYGYKIRGLTPGDAAISASALMQHVHPDDRAARQQWIDDLLAGRMPGAHEEHTVRPDGEVRLLRLEGGVVRGEDGTITHLAGTVQDITAQRELELRLAHMQKMEALGGLTGGMAHDFNNILGIIIVNLEMLKRMLEYDRTAREICCEALDGANRCAELIRSLLAFARRQPLRPQRIDVNRLVRETMQFLMRTLGETISVVLELEAQPWPALVDPAQLEAALVNLASNARDAMPRGGSLTVATRNIHFDVAYADAHADVAAGDYILIEMTDTGSGIPADILDKIFDPFFTTKAPGHGTGLGLSMVFGFTKQSNGHVTVYSEPGIGTTIRLYLPRCLAAAAPTEGTGPSEPLRGGNETILLVEDNHHLRAAVARQLTDFGYRVLDLADADQAMQVLSGDTQIDLLLTDVVMPGKMNGFELARAATARRAGLCVLLTSGFAGWQANALPAGADVSWVVLHKPYSRESLARAVREALAPR